MIKKIIKDNYTIEFPDTVNYNEEEINNLIDDTLHLIKHKELQDSPEPRLIHSDGKLVEKGDEVIDFRGNKAIVTGWQAPAFKGKSGRVYVKEILEEGKTFDAGYYPEVYGLKWKGLPWEKKEDVEDIKIEDIFEPISSFKTYKFINKNRNGLEIIKAFEDLKDHRMHVIVHRPSDNSYIIGLGYNPDDGVWNQGRYDFGSLEEAEKSLKENYNVKEFVKDIKIEDVPVNAPEENVSITYTEKLKGGKNALTYGMIEEAFKQRAKDDGQTFAAYLDVAIESLKDDIANAKYIVSGEMKSTRGLLLEDYVKMEHLAQKAGLTDKVEEMKPLIDELSEKLDLNYFKQPKFKKSEMKSVAKELRNKHRWDSKIEKALKPVFLCSKSDLTASYNDAKQGKLPQVFEGNLRKVEKDMEADYDRINQGRDHYMDDPRIIKLLPEIVSLYDTAKQYAEDLGYNEIADRFAYMLLTIKKGWGLE